MCLDFSMPVDCGGDVRPCLPCVPRVNDVCAACELLVVFSTFHNPRWELTFEFISDKLPRHRLELKKPDTLRGGLCAGEALSLRPRGIGRRRRRDVGPRSFASLRSLSPSHISHIAAAHIY